MAFHLHHVSIYCGQNRMTVVASLIKGEWREVDLRWKTKEPTDVPPENWVEMVETELEISRTEELKKEKGQWIPRK